MKMEKRTEEKATEKAQAQAQANTKAKATMGNHHSCITHFQKKMCFATIVDKMDMSCTLANIRSLATA